MSVMEKEQPARRTRPGEFFLVISQATGPVTSDWIGEKCGT